MTPVKFKISNLNKSKTPFKKINPLRSVWYTAHRNLRPISFSICPRWTNLYFFLQHEPVFNWDGKSVSFFFASKCFIKIYIFRVSLCTYRAFPSLGELKWSTHGCRSYYFPSRMLNCSSTLAEPKHSWKPCRWRSCSSNNHRSALHLQPGNLPPLQSSSAPKTWTLYAAEKLFYWGRLEIIRKGSTFFLLKQTQVLPCITDLHSR